MMTSPFSAFLRSLASTSLSNLGEPRLFSRNLIPSAVSHQSSPVAWYPSSWAISFRMSPPPTRGTFSSFARSFATVVLPTAGMPHIMIALNGRSRGYRGSEQLLEDERERERRERVPPEERHPSARGDEVRD